MTPADENRIPGPCPGWRNGCGSRGSACRMRTAVAGEKRSDQGVKGRRGELHPLEREPVWRVTDENALEGAGSAGTGVPGPNERDAREQGRANIGQKACTAEADVAECRGRRERRRLPADLYVQIGPYPIPQTIIHCRASVLAVMR